MVEYKCIRCNYVTCRKSNFKNHLLRKTLCKCILNEIPIIDFYSNYLDDFPEVSSKINICLKSPPKSTKSPPNLHQNPPKCFLSCSYCNKSISRSDSLQRHEKNRCKIKKIIDTEENNNQIINNTNNGTINTNNGTINNIVNIVPIGQENINNVLSNLEKKMILNCGVYSMLPKLVETIHCNKKYPQFQNFKITNLNNKYCHEFDAKKNEFKIVLKKKLMEKLVDYKRYELEEIFNSTPNIPDKAKQYIDKIIDKIDNGDKKYINEIIDEIILLVYNFYIDNN